MKILVSYDIIETPIRNRIIDFLFNFGFQRIQFSVFIGEISKKRLNTFVNSLQIIIDNEKDSLYIFNICEKDFNNCIFLGKIINKQFLNDSFLIF